MADTILVSCSRNHLRSSKVLKQYQLLIFFCCVLFEVFSVTRGLYHEKNILQRWKRTNRPCPIYRFPDGYRRVCSPNNQTGSQTNQDATCGLRDWKDLRVIERRVVGGRPAEPKEFPWQVSIERHDGDSFQHYGGAVILSRRWLITAAHVVQDKDSKLYQGKCGITDLTERGQILKFDRIIVHENFGKRNLENDIALLRVNKDIPLYPANKYLNEVCLPSKKDLFKGQVTISGWGEMDNEGYINTTLMTAEIRILDDKVCEKTFARGYNKALMLCAGDIRGGKDSCRGDSGGPLIKMQNGRAVLAGLVSFGRKNACGAAGIGAAYAKISYYLDWIKSNVK